MAYGSDRANPYRVRLGIDVPRARGVNTEVDPAALPPDQFRRLENVDFRGNRIVNRKGLAKVNSSGAMTGSVMGIADDRGNNGSGKRIYYIGIDENGLAIYDPSQTTTYEYVSTFPFSNVATGSLGSKNRMLFFDAKDGYVYFAKDDADTLSAASSSTKLYRFRPGVVTSPGGSIATAQAMPEPVFQFSPTYATDASIAADSMQRVGSLLYIGASEKLSAGGSAVDAYVYRYDGTTLTQEDTYSITDSVNLTAVIATYRNRPVVLYATNSSLYPPVVRYKDDAGTWQSIAWPGGNGARFSSVCEYKDKLFVSGYTGTAFQGAIWQISGTTMTAVKTISSMTGLDGIQGLATDGTYLYYTYYKTNFYMGRYDDSSFSDTYATVATAPFSNAEDSGPIVIQGKKLYTILTNNTTGPYLRQADLPTPTSFSTATQFTNMTAGIIEGYPIPTQTLVAV
jgi:hypothetical protein